MIYTCNKCRFIFSRSGKVEQYPDRGTYGIRPADEAKKQACEDRLKEPSEL